ncbi:MAG: thioredoxin-disulfide reductase [Chloroflexota bacterium]
MRSYQVIVLGGGPGGLTAGLYASRGGLHTLVLEKQMPGGQVATTDRIENYPCCAGGISGTQLMSQIEAQAKSFGLESESAEVLGLSLEGETKVVHTDRGDFEAGAIIIATGAHPATLGVPREDEFRSRGVSYCATCDGPFYRDKVVAVVGGGDSAIQEAIYLSRLVAEVVVVHRRDSLRAADVLQQRAFANPKIRFLWNKTAEAVQGADSVEGLALRDTITGERSLLPVDGVFVFVGQRPNASFLDSALELDAQGYIITDEEMRTNVPGVFAAGDVRHKSLRQMVTATADGAIAANSSDLYLEEQEASRLDPLQPVVPLG